MKENDYFGYDKDINEKPYDDYDSKKRKSNFNFKPLFITIGIIAAVALIGFIIISSYLNSAGYIAKKYKSAVDSLELVTKDDGTQYYVADEDCKKLFEDLNLYPFIYSYDDQVRMADDISVNVNVIDKFIELYSVDEYMNSVYKMQKFARVTDYYGVQYLNSEFVAKLYEGLVDTGKSRVTNIADLEGSNGYYKNYAGKDTEHFRYFGDFALEETDLNESKSYKAKGYYLKDGKDGTWVDPHTVTTWYYDVNWYYKGEQFSSTQYQEDDEEDINALYVYIGHDATYFITNYSGTYYNFIQIK